MAKLLNDEVVEHLPLRLANNASETHQIAHYFQDGHLY